MAEESSWKKRLRSSNRTTSSSAQTVVNDYHEQLGRDAKTPFSSTATTHKDSVPSSYVRWCDGHICTRRSCRKLVHANDACVVLATDEVKRRRMPHQTKNSNKHPKNTIQWIPHGRQVLHQRCYDDLCQSSKDKFASPTELRLCRAAQTTAEFHEGADTVHSKTVQMARLMWSATIIAKKRLPSLPTKPAAVSASLKPSPILAVFTGAGISATAGIPTYRGTDGIDTKHKLKHESPKDDSDEETDFTALQPTLTHTNLAELEHQHWLRYVASQNCDNLHRKAGTSPNLLTELHGNVFVEYCPLCYTEYERTYEVDAYSTDCYKEPYYKKCRHCGLGHYTGRTCDAVGCSGYLQDTIVNFGDPLHSCVLGGLEKATEKFQDAHICLAMGSSLAVSPANLLVTMPRYLVIVNLQKTDLDNKANMRVWCESDQFMKNLMEELQKGPPGGIDLLSLGDDGGPQKCEPHQELEEEINYSHEQEALRQASCKVVMRNSKRKRK